MFSQAANFHTPALEAYLFNLGQIVGPVSLI